MKNNKLLVLSVSLLGLSTFALVPTKSIHINAEVSDDSFYVIESEANHQDGTIVDVDFSKAEENSVWDTRQGFYCMGKVQNGKVSYTGAANWTEFSSILGNDAFKNTTIAFDVVVELVGVKEVYATVRQNWNANDATSILREIGVQDVSYDENGKITGFNNRVGWLNGSDDTSLDVKEITEEGYLKLHFEARTNEQGIVAVPFGVVGVNTEEATVNVISVKATDIAVDHIKQANEKYDFDDGNVAVSNKYAVGKAEVSDGKLVTSSSEVMYPYWDFNIYGVNADKGRHYVSFDVIDTQNVLGVEVDVLTADENSADPVFSAYSIYLDEAKTPYIVPIGGWKSAGQENIVVRNVTKNANGTIHCYFEYELEGNEGANILAFKQKNSDADNKVIWDNIECGVVVNEANKVSKYYSYDENSDFEDLSQTGLPFNYSALWGYANNTDTLLWQTEDPISGSRSVKIGYAAAEVNNLQLGGFANDEMNWTDGVTYYFSYDLKLDFDVTKANIWTQGTYSSVQFDYTHAWAEGEIKNFKYTLVDDVFHVSYSLTWAANMPSLNINMYGQGYITIDNLKISHEDYTPFAKGTVNYATDTMDLVYNAKGKELTGIEKETNGVKEMLDNCTVDAENNSISIPISSYDSLSTYYIVTEAGKSSISLVENDCLKSIIVDATNAKTTYVKGDELDLSGVVVTSVLGSGTKSQVNITADMVSGYDKNTVGEQIVTITYEGKSSTYTVMVEEPAPIEPPETSEEPSVEVSEPTPSVEPSVEVSEQPSVEPSTTPSSEPSVAPSVPSISEPEVSEQPAQQPTKKGCGGSATATGIGLLAVISALLLKRRKH